MAENRAWSLGWSDRFEVGVESLDADHRELVRLIDAACRAAQDGQKAELLALLEQLEALALSHFDREEAILRTVPGIEPEMASHANGHKRNIERLTSLREGLVAGDGLGSVDQFCGELIDWFVRQAVGHDSRIRGYFHNGR